MFSSLASFIFGSNTSATTNSEANQNPIPEQEKRERESDQRERNAANERIDAENTIEVTSSTPSVTGTNRNFGVRQGKRGKNKRGGKQFNNNTYNKKQASVQGQVQGQGQGKTNVERKRESTPSITKLLTPSESFEEEFNEEDWCFVEKEDENASLPRTDSEEELSIVEVKPKAVVAAAVGAAGQQRHRPHIHSQSLYSGPRPQQQRNHLQRVRNSGARTGVLSISALSPPRSIAVTGFGVGAAGADGGVTQSLYVVPHGNNNNGSVSVSGLGNGATVSMEESWFVTPPPCFTSIGPINMETSPFENLLIEHPSMSVYHSIRSAQEATDSFVNLDLGVEKSQQQQQQQQRQQQPFEVVQPQNGRRTQVQQQRAAMGRLDRYSAAQIKQEILARNNQKSHEKKERQNLCRTALKRGNKVRDIQAKGSRQRRSDMQHCKVISGANNNRKCCY